MAHLVKNLPAMQETRVHSLGWEYSLEKGMAPHPVFLPREFHGQRSLGLATRVANTWTGLTD